MVINDSLECITANTPDDLVKMLKCCKKKIIAIVQYGNRQVAYIMDEEKQINKIKKG